MGDLLSLGSAASYAAYTVLVKPSFDPSPDIELRNAMPLSPVRLNVPTTTQVMLKKAVKDESRISMSLFFGLIGQYQP